MFGSSRPSRCIEADKFRILPGKMDTNLDHCPPDISMEGVHTWHRFNVSFVLPTIMKDLFLNDCCDG